jgi:large subunit ribosomal protein L18
MSKSYELMVRRKRRSRIKIKNARGVRPRLSVFRSGKHIYAQIIDDLKGITVASASTLEKQKKTKISNGGNIGAASTIGKTIAERGIKKGIKEVIFDRGGFKYHGRVKALAESARESGLSF